MVWSSAYTHPCYLSGEGRDRNRRMSEDMLGPADKGIASPARKRPAYRFVRPRLVPQWRRVAGLFTSYRSNR